MKQDANKWEKICEFIISVSNLAVDWKINSAGTHYTTISDEDTVVSSTYYGNPQRMDKGIPTARHKTVKVKDNYIGFLNDICKLCKITEPGEVIARYESTVYNYEFLELIAKPIDEVSTVATMVLKIFNMDGSLGKNRDPNPKYLEYPVIDTAKNAMSIAIHLVVYYIFKKYPLEAIQVYIGINNPTFPWQKFKDKMATLNDPINDSVFNAIASNKRITNIDNAVKKKIIDQLNAGFTEQELAWLVALGDHQAEIDASVSISAVKNRYNQIIATLDDKSIGSYMRTIKTNVVTYKICGAGALITNATYALVANGTICRSSYSTRVTVAEQIIKHIRLIKRTIKYPTSNMGGSKVYQTGNHWATIQIATTDWDSIRHVFYGSCSIVSQVSDTYSFMTNDYEKVKSLFGYFKGKPGVKTVRINYSFLTGQGTATVSNIVSD